MNETKALIRRDDASLSVEFTPAALEMKRNALEVSALVGRVNDAASQESAVTAQQEIANILTLAEKARKAAKEAPLEYGRRIDSAAKAFIGELKEEQVRLATLVGNFQMLEQARVRAAQQAENERLMELEREKARALAQVETHEEHDRINQEFSQRVAAEAATPIAPIRAEGQRVVPDWDVTVTDIWMLAKAHPTCVRIEPLVGEIKSLLKAGVKVAGVTAKPIVKAGVTTSRTRAIEV